MQKKIVNGIEEYAKDIFDEDILNHFSNAPVGVPNVINSTGFGWCYFFF